MKRSVINLAWFSALLTTVFGVPSWAVSQGTNPRSASVIDVAPQRADGRAVVRSDSGNTQLSSGTARSTLRRVAGATDRAGQTKVRGAIRPASDRTDASVVRSAVNVPARAANVSQVSQARSGKNVSNVGLARAASTARATAVFTDVSKIGGGYAKCRDAYATCMDQFCANANDTYRRCYCSERFTEFRDTEAALDEAKTLLMRFEDNNLNAVDKTAAEVNAMYSATVGEAAIKKDTSAAQNILNEIGDLLAGKKKASSGSSASTSLGIMSLDFSTDMDDIWGGGAGSIFDTSTGVDLTSLEGLDLFNASNKQCLQLIADSCENKAVLNMATSSYGILISQDCNTYEKKVNAQREAVKQTVRQAEKYLRDARLEEYRAHNSADVNECIAKVRTALTADTACGVKYKRCLDYSGAYVNQSTGEAIYSPRLFELENLISLAGATGDFDVLGQNPKFNKFLDEKRTSATSALDTCRDIADIVWEEFKRVALIEIAQAQDEKIEEVKTSCVSTMAECYDGKTNALKDFDVTTAQAAGAISAYAAKAMCQDKVTACAALYGNNAECTFDGNGKLTSNPSSCGLTALLSFVDTVDNVRVAEGCATAIDNYVQELCTPATGSDMGYPWDCRDKIIGTVDDAPSVQAAASVAANIKYFAVQNCGDPTAEEKSYDTLPLLTRTQVEKSIRDVAEQLDFQLMDTCEKLGGFWVDAKTAEGNLLNAFYTSAFGGERGEVQTSAGKCLENTTMVMCLNYNTTGQTPVASYDLAKDECTFTDEWYRMQCQTIGGYYDMGMCYVGKE